MELYAYLDVTQDLPNSSWESIRIDTEIMLQSIQEHIGKLCRDF